jgi:hypothetical protein
VPLGPVSTCWRTVRATLSPQKRQKQVWDKAVVCSALQLRRWGVSRWRERVARLVMVRGLAVWWFASAAVLAVPLLPVRVELALVGAS